MYDVVLPLIWSLHFWSPVVSSGQRATGSRSPPPTGNLYIVFLCFVCVCVWYLNDGTLLPSWTRDVWAAWRIGENSPDREVGLRSAWKCHVIRETTGSTFHSRGSRRNSLFYRCTTTVYCILWPWMFIDGVGGSWGGWDRAVKTVCMSTVFYQASDGVKLYLYYLFYVRVKLNSWHRNIEELFKQTGCSLVIF